MKKNIIKLQKIKYEEKHILQNLLELYQYDLSEFNDNKVNDSGAFGYKYLDHYWTEEGRFGFFIKVKEKLAGFVLVRIFDEEDKKINSIAEFFIMNKYRKQGIGKEIAFKIFDKFTGLWNVAQEKENISAQNFWRKIIAEYTDNNFKEVQKDYYWDGPIQEFESKNK